MENNYSLKWFAFIGIALVTFACYLDYTVVNIALPTIQRELNVTITSLQWIMNIYFLALCVLATIMGRCGDLYGRRKLFYVGTGIFGIASLIAGFAPNIECIIFGRLLQGVGAALVLPLGASMLPGIFPPNQAAKSIAWLGSLGGIALALGPVMGGYIVSYWGWRWIFFINIPIVILGYLFCLKSVKESLVTLKNRDLDFTGMFLLMLTMGGLVLGLIRAETHGWSNVLTLTFLSVGVISSIILFKVENKKENSLIDFADFSKLLFYCGAMMCMLAGVMSACSLFFDPIYLQVILGQTPEYSGFVLFVIPVAVFFVAFIVGWLIHLIGIIPTIIIGMSLSVLAGLSQIFFSHYTPLWYIVISFIFLGGMWAIGNTASIIAGQSAVPSDRASAATGTIVTMFNIGGSLGLAIAVVIYHWRSNHFLGEFVGQQNIANEDLQHLQQSLENPTHALQSSMSDAIHDLFNAAFIHGFTGVMWFLFLLSAIILSSVLIWKMKEKKI